MFALRRLLIGILPLLLLIYGCTVDEEENQILILTPSKITLKVSETTNLNINLGGIERNNGVIWSSDNASVATVSNGMITAISRGVTTIKATLIDIDKEYIATSQVTVIQPVEGISFSLSEIALKVGSTTNLTYTIAPSNANNQTVTWSSDNPSVATVTNGTIAALNKGIARITATTVDGEFSASSTITVSQPVTNISLSPSTVTLKVGSTTNLTYTIAPSNANNQNVTWSSDNPSVATVTNGTITALNKGITRITATTADGGFSASSTITVSQPVTNIFLSPSIVILKAGSTTNLTYTIAPSNANNQTVTWSSDNPSVATVTNGTITALNRGVARITATTADGGFSASSTITVSQPVTNIFLSPSIVILKVGSTTNLTYTIAPSNANNQTVTWSSDNPSVATVTNGTIAALSRGVATITATTADGGFSASSTITVSQPVTSISLSPSIVTLKVGSTTNLTYTIAPSNANNQNVTWSSDNPSVATVTNGTIAALNRGIATITATTVDGGFSASSTIMVPPDTPQNFRQVNTCKKSTSADLAWDTSAEATYYQLLQGDQIISSNILPSHTVTGLTPNTTTSFQVKACADSGCSDPATLSIRTANYALETIITTGRIPTDLSIYDKPSQDIFSLYPANAEVVAKYLKPSGTGDGSHFTNAATNLQAIMNGITSSASKVYAVLLTGGTYNTLGSIEMKNYIAIIGGVDDCLAFSDTEITIMDARGPLYSERETGKQFFSVFSNQNLDRTALLYGFTIFQGRADSNEHGAGMYNYLSSPTLIGVTFSENIAIKGGGMYNKESSPLLIGVTFVKNTGRDGGAMHNEDSSPVLVNVTFSENKGTGPGMYNKESSPILIGTTFYENIADGNDPGNHNDRSGSGIYNDNNGEDGPLIVNSILAGNSYDKESLIFLTENSVEEKLTIYDSSLKRGIPSGLVNGQPYANNDFNNPGDFGFGLGSSTGSGHLIVNYGRIHSGSGINGNLDDNGGLVKTHLLPLNSTVRNKGLHIKMSGTTLYYSMNNTAWYTDITLTGNTENPPSDAIDLTKYDATGYIRTDRPDLGAYEAR